METGHRAQIGGQRFALARLKLLDEVIHGLLDEQLRGVIALCGALLIGRIAAAPLRRIFPVRRGVGCWLRRCWRCWLHVVAALGNSISMLLVARCGANWRPKRKSTQTKFFSLSAPASWLFATGGGGKVQSRAGVRCPFIEAKRRPLTGSSRLG